MDRLLFRNGIVAEVQVPKFRNSDFAVSPDHIMTSWQSRNAFDQSQRLRNRAKEQVAVDRFTAKLCRHQVGAQKRAHFGSENQLTVFLKIVERLNSERSARDETRSIDIVPNRQPKHPSADPSLLPARTGLPQPSASRKTIPNPSPLLGIAKTSQRL